MRHDTSIVARRSLLELAKLRGLLDGSIDPKDLGVEGKTDGGARREAALRLVDRLGRLYAAVLETAGAAEEAVFHMAGGKELLDGQEATKPEEPRQRFGFAAGRRDAA